MDEYRRAKYEANRALAGATEASMHQGSMLTEGSAYIYHREPTAKVAVAQRDTEDITGVFDRRHTDGERRAVKEFVGGIIFYAWQRGGKWAAAIGSGGGIYHLLHKLGIL